ncbi:hypothetical protein F5Y10DRAFT_243431 [Nemania abortiva]|nr:hypothetical protein F5Y10DRAFT_243431 [Nemania abortiva]
MQCTSTVLSSMASNLSEQTCRKLPTANDDVPLQELNADDVTLVQTNNSVISFNQPFVAKTGGIVQPDQGLFTTSQNDTLTGRLTETDFDFSFAACSSCDFGGALAPQSEWCSLDSMQPLSNPEYATGQIVQKSSIANFPPVQPQQPPPRVWSAGSLNDPLSQQFLEVPASFGPLPVTNASTTGGSSSFDGFIEPILDSVGLQPDQLNDSSCFNCFDGLAWPLSASSQPRPIAPNPAAKESESLAPASLPGTDMISSISPKRKRGAFDNEGRSKVKKVRRLGACLRCRIYRLACNEELPCLNCVKVKDKQKVYRGPCIRPNIFDVQSFRAGDGDNGQLRSILPEYRWLPGRQTKVVTIRWPFLAQDNDPILSVTCQLFTPQVGQNIMEEYSIGKVVRQIELPPWACRDTKTAQKNIRLLLEESQSRLESKIFETLEDPIMKLTWIEAKRFQNAHNSTLVAKAFQVFAGAMLNSKYPMSVKDNVFGVPEESEIPYFCGKLPLPAQLTYQIQTMVSLGMREVQAKLLKELKSRIFHKDRQRHWYEVYLTVFVLLATIEFVYRVQMRFVRAKAGVSTRNLANITFVTQSMLDEWEASALNLIDHFRCVMNGEVAFSQPWDDDSENARRSGLDPPAIEYIRTIKREVESRMDELLALRNPTNNRRFENPLAAVCELFLPAEEV